MNNVMVLKPKQLSAVKLLAAGTPACQVAARLEITTMTLWRWQQLPAFEETLHSVSYSGLDEIAKKINITALTAIETLQELLCNMCEPAEIRVKAAVAVLRAMPSVNGSLERSYQHRAADFDLRTRFCGPSFSYDSWGTPIRSPRTATLATVPAAVTDEGVTV